MMVALVDCLDSWYPSCVFLWWTQWVAVGACIRSFITERGSPSTSPVRGVALQNRMASTMEQAVLSGLASTQVADERTWHNNRASAAGADATVIQFLRAKLVERDRTIFQLRSQLTQADEALHGLKRLLGTTNSNDARPHHDDHTLQLLREEQWKRHLWKATSQVIVKSLLERLALTTEWASGAMDIALLANSFRNVAASTAGATTELSSATYASLLSSMRTLDTQKSALQAELVKYERLLASLTTECKRYQNDAAEERLRADILAKRIGDLSAVHASSRSTAQQMEALETTVHNANREICRLRDEQRELCARNRESEQRYRELLASRERILGELEALRMDVRHQQRPSPPQANSARRAMTSSALDIMLASPKGAGSPTSSMMLTTGPIRLGRVASIINRRGEEGNLFDNTHESLTRNPYRTGMPSIIS